MAAVSSQDGLSEAELKELMLFACGFRKMPIFTPNCQVCFPRTQETSSTKLFTGT